MALAKDVICGGISPAAASTLGGLGASVAATGTDQSTAATITSSVCIITGADGTTGVILPACGPGESVFIFNNSASTLKVYPPTGAAISVAGTGLGASNAAFSQLTYKGTIYQCQSTTQWFALTTA